MPKSLTEMICSMPEKETGEMKLRAPGRLKTTSLVLSVVRIYFKLINSRPVKKILVCSSFLVTIEFLPRDAL